MMALIPFLAPPYLTHRYSASSLWAGAVVCLCGLGLAIIPLAAAHATTPPPSPEPTLIATTATFQAGVSRQAQEPSAASLSEPGVVGLDLRLSPRGVGYPLIAAVLPGTPAWRCGLKPGDLIVAVDGLDTYGLSRQALDEAIGDRPGQVMVLVIARGQRVLPPVRLTVAGVSTLAKASRAYFSPSESTERGP